MQASQSRRKRAAYWLLLFSTAPLWAISFAVLDRALFSWVSGAVFTFELWDLIPGLAPLGALLVAILALLAESWVRGFSQSSLKRILSGSPSAEADLFHTFLYASNLKNILGFIFALGLGHLAHHWIIENFSLGLLAGRGFPVSFAILFLVNSFLFYWTHRVMHTKLFWEVHKVHHSATEMNLITSFRNHPLNILVELFFYSVSAALLGAPFHVAIAYSIVNGLYQLLAHSEGSWGLRGGRWGFIQDWVLIAPEEHRIHHSRAQEHWDKNFGLTPIWDRIFGTWQIGLARSPILLGLDDEPDQQLFSGLRGVFVFAFRFFSSLRFLWPLRLNKKYFHHAGHSLRSDLE